MSAPPSETPRIMIVDDSVQNLELLEAMMLGQGYDVAALPSGELALEAVERLRPHLILLDVRMPGLDGYEVCARLKARPEFRDIPVLFLSALAEPADRARGFQAGGAEYITKPFRLKDVEARVRQLLEPARPRPQ